MPLRNLTKRQKSVNIPNQKSSRDDKEKILSTKSLLPVKFITDPWQWALVIKSKW